MHRCYIQRNNWQDKYAFPSKEELHHITHVMRLKIGETIEIFDGEGGEALAIVVKESGEPESAICLKIVSDVITVEQSVKLTLFQAIPKGKRIDTLIEKCTELGINEIVPMITQRVIVKINDSKSQMHKINRWQSIALNAAKQCGRADIPAIKEIVTLENIFDKVEKPTLMLIASLNDSAVRVQEAIQKIKSEGKKVETIGVFIGPEGDFTEKEHSFLVAEGAVPVSLGKLIMRVETASIYVTSILAYEFIN